VRLPLWP